MGKRRVRVALGYFLAAAMLLTGLAGLGPGTARAAVALDSTGATLYAQGGTSVYVAANGMVAISGHDPSTGENYENFTLVPFTARTTKGSVAIGDEFIAYIDPAGGFGLANRTYYGDENPLAAAPKAGTEMEMVAAGSDHLLTLSDAAEVKAVGSNQQGQLGSADGGYVMEALYIAAGEQSSFAIDLDNNLYAWGRNHVGQLGVGDKEDRREPAFVMSNVKEVWTSGTHTFARTYSGQLYGWGSNTSGQLGIDTNKKNVLSPRKINSDYVSVAAGKRHTLFMDKYGSVYASGSNQNYELGRSSRETLHGAVSLGRKAQAVAAGDGFTLMITQKSGIFAGMGRNDGGQLGLSSKATFAKKLTQLRLPEFTATGDGGSAPSGGSVPATAVSFTGEITHVSGNTSILVEVTAGSALASADLLLVNIPDSQRYGQYRIGDQVRVYFDGTIAESYPGQVLTTYYVEVVK